jgi:hypothetical protein
MSSNSFTPRQELAKLASRTPACEGTQYQAAKGLTFRGGVIARRVGGGDAEEAPGAKRLRVSGGTRTGLAGGGAQETAAAKRLCASGGTRAGLAGGGAQE